MTSGQRTRGCSDHGLRHKVCAQTHTKPFNLQFSRQAGVAPHEALLLNSLRQLLSAAPAMEATVSGWCSAGRRERRRVAAAAEKPAIPEREGAAPGPHANDHIKGISPAGGRLQVPSSRLAMHGARVATHRKSHLLHRIVMARSCSAAGHAVRERRTLKC